MSERIFIYMEANSMPNLKVCVSTLCDARTTTKLPNDAFLRTYPRRYATHICSRLYYPGLCKYTVWRLHNDEIA